MENIKNIIFDYGNVIFMIDFTKAQKAFTDLGIKDVEKFFAHSGQTSFFDAFEKGEIDAATFRKNIREASAMPNLTDNDIDEAWNSLLIGVSEGSHDLLMKVKQNYNTFLLSNNNEIHYSYIIQYLKREFNLNDNANFFVKDYYSHLMGMRKPNADIFEYVLKEHHLNPQETLFIDDSPQHIAAAKALGIHTALLTAPETLEQLLKSKNLI